MSQDPGHASAPELSAVSPPSLYLRLMALSACSALKLAVVMIIMTTSQWLQMPPIKTTVQVIWDKMTGSCHKGRRGGAWDLYWLELCITDVVTFLLIHLTESRALANAQQPCEVRCSPDSNRESYITYIQYLSRNLSYHKRGSRRVMILLDIRSPPRRREPGSGRWKCACIVDCETATIIKQSDG